MEGIFYNILWIDDEHKTLGGTKGRAKRNGIKLIPFKSLNGGMSELERNYPFYDGVLLDAKFFENEDDEKGTENTYNVHRAKEQLLQLKKKFEVFILTGQAEVYEDKTFKKAFTKVYKKGSDKEIDRLFADIKKSAALQEDTQIRHTYKRVFEVCTERYIGEFAGQDILNLLKIKDDINIESHFNTIRKVVEDLFLAFNKYKLLPNEFINPNIALNPSSIFLAGLEQRENTKNIYKQHRHLPDTHLDPQIVYYLKNILAVTQSGSHRSDTGTFVRSVKTPFLLKSIIFQLLDVIVWFKMYVDSNPKIENWENIETPDISGNSEKEKPISGEVININTQKGFAFLEPDILENNIFIPPHMVTSYSLVEGMKIKVEIEDYKHNRTFETKTRVKKIIENT